MANITTVRERARGCGFRKGGGIYLRTDGIGRYCGALPIELSVCPTCHAGIKPARGWTWINLAAMVGAGRGCEKKDGCGDCPIADAQIQTVGLLWVGEKFYGTPADFSREAERMGVSRRIAAVPKGFKIGKTWVALAHRKAVPVQGVNELQLESCTVESYKPGVFHVFCPARIEYVVKGTESEEQLEALEKRGFSLVKVEPLAD